jgi:hypothetical protein
MSFLRNANPRWPQLFYKCIMMKKELIIIVTSLLVYRLDHEEGMLLCAPVGLILTVLPKNDAAFVTCKIFVVQNSRCPM